MQKMLIAAAILALAACQPAPKTQAPAAEAATAVTAPENAWLGTWIGVEGTTLTIDPGEPGKFYVTGLSLDGPYSFEGAVHGDVIRFVRAGLQETIRKGDGAATGLKYLEGKTDCIVIKEGEGFCRD